MSYLIYIYTAVDYDHKKGWIYSSSDEIIPFENKEDAQAKFSQLKSELSFKTSISGMATKVELEEQSAVYEGESVLGWYAAYKILVPIGRRRSEFKKFIDKIKIDTSFYAFKYRYANNAGISVEAIAPTLEEVQEQLGERVKHYPVVE